MNAPLGYIAGKKGLNELLQEIGAFLVEATQGQNDDGAGRQLDLSLDKFWRSYALLRSRSDEPLAVAVLALTKSGKSTLLNALTSSECLPMNNVPETSRICKVTHLAQGNAEPWLQEPGSAQPIRGERNIRARLTALNSAMRCHTLHAPAAIDEHVLNIHAPIAALREYDGSGVPPLALLDTPGPNEAGEEGLRYQVDRLLDSVDAVVYLLDYTKLKTAEEADMFRRLKQINPQLVKRLSQRLFFVVNKADTADVCEGMGADDTRAYIAGIVTQQLGGDGFQLQPEQVLLVSARNALLSRLVLNGKASEDMVRRFSNLAFGNAFRSRPAATADQFRSAALTLLSESGVLDLEAQILTFLYAHSAGVKLMTTLDNVSRLLSEMSNVALSCRACLRTNVDQLAVQTSSMQEKLIATLAHFDNVLTGTEMLQSEVTDEIRAHLHSLRVRLVNHILQTLEAADVPGAALPDQASAPSSAPLAPPRVPRRWQALRDKFLAMFTSTTAGAATARSQSHEELQQLLADLHEGLMSQIHSEVGEFWSVLEACTNARHAALVRQLNTLLATLSKQVEEAVCTGLNVQLMPVDLSMPSPAAEQFHSDLQALISKGIHVKHESHLRVNQKQTEEKVLRFRNGVCQWGAYWETIPLTRSVVEAYHVKVYELKPGEVSQHFIDLVDDAIDATSCALSAYVRTFVSAQIGAARSNIKEYSERYLSAMMAALETSQRGVEAREAALGLVDRHVDVLAGLSGKAIVLQGQAEALVPQLEEALPYDESSDEEILISRNRPLSRTIGVHEGPEDEAAPPQPFAAAAAPALAPLSSCDPFAAIADIRQSLSESAASDNMLPHIAALSEHATSEEEDIGDADAEEDGDESVNTYSEDDVDNSVLNEALADSSDDHYESGSYEGTECNSPLADPLRRQQYRRASCSSPPELASGSEKDSSGNSDEEFEVGRRAPAFALEADGLSLDGSFTVNDSFSIGGSFMSCAEPLLPAAPLAAPAPAATVAPLLLPTVPAANAASSSLLESAVQSVDSDELSELLLATTLLPGANSATVADLSWRDEHALAALRERWRLRNAAPAASGDESASRVMKAPAVPVSSPVAVDSESEAQVSVLPSEAVAPASFSISDERVDSMQDDSVEDLFADAAGSKFDYCKGFVRAMSTSAMTVAAEEAAAAAADEWTLLDDNGSTASEAGDSPTSGSAPVLPMARA